MIRKVAFSAAAVAAAGTVFGLFLGEKALSRCVTVVQDEVVCPLGHRIVVYETGCGINPEPTTTVTYEEETGELFWKSRKYHEIYRLAGAVEILVDWVAPTSLKLSSAPDAKVQFKVMAFEGIDVQY